MIYEGNLFSLISSFPTLIATENTNNSPLWYSIELMAVKKNSETISTLPFKVMTVSLGSTILDVLVDIGLMRAINLESR